MKKCYKMFLSQCSVLQDASVTMECCKAFLSQWSVLQDVSVTAMSLSQRNVTRYVGQSEVGYKMFLSQRSVLNTSLSRRREVLQDVSSTMKLRDARVSQVLQDVSATAIPEVKRGMLQHVSVTTGCHKTFRRNEVCYKTYLSQGSMLQDVVVTKKCYKMSLPQ